MSQYDIDLEAAHQELVDAQAAAAQALELLRIAQALAPRGIKYNQAVERLIKDYFAGNEFTLQDFENAYAIESLPGGRQTLRSMLETSTQTIPERNKKMKSLSYEELQQKAREEARVKEANRAHPTARPIPPGTPILPAFVTRRWLKEVSMDTIKSLRIKIDRERGQGYFNKALEWRTSGADNLELRRLYRDMYHDSESGE